MHTNINFTNSKIDTMQRRKFIKNTGALGVGSMLLNGIPVKTMASPLSPDFTCREIEERILVMVNLFGANDTLNTVVPSAQYGIYATNRPVIKIPQANTLTLDTANNINPTTLHPSMTAFKALYDAGKLNVVHGVGYANNNRSHFKSDELWNTAGDSTPANYDFDSGWAGQLFEYRYPGLLGSSTPALSDPPCVELGATSGSVLFQTSLNNNASLLLTNTNASSFYNTLQAVGGPSPANIPTSDYGLELKYVDDIHRLSSVYAQRVQTVFNAGTNAAGVTYPNTYLANQLKTVARLIKGGSKTSVYMVHHTGYDTHGDQINTGDPLTGQHTNLLVTMTQAIKAFQDDITAQGFADRVMTATYSEFGRTIDENSGMGTDHGGVSTMFVIGNGAKPGITGTPINLNMVDSRALTDLQYDYRRVWAALLQDFMGHGPNPMNAARMQPYLASKAPIITTTHIADPSCYINQMNVLPVSLVDFTGAQLPSGVVALKWKTVFESNSKQFDVQHSTNGITWTTIGTVNAAGSSSVERNYSFEHSTPTVGKNFYQLAQVDLNGSKRKYGPVAIIVRDKASFTVKSYPNPAQFDFNVVVTAEKSQKATIQFYDVQGHLLNQSVLQIKNGFNKFNYLTNQFKGYKGELIVNLKSEFDIQKTWKQIIQ
jgi:uncharacterized protein (DUF1501 family)